jgi:hypothetical protein
MTGLHALWLPMVLSAVAVFFASSVIHMFSGLHKNDFVAPPNADGLADAIRPFNLTPGDYMIPRPSSMKEMGSPEFKAKAERGPKLVFTVFPNGIMPMGPLLAKWFVYSLGISLVAGYVAGRALPVGADYLHVFRFAGVTAFLGYSGALPHASIWYGKSWGTTLRSTIDGLIYAGLTAGLYGWLWPR